MIINSSVAANKATAKIEIITVSESIFSNKNGTKNRTIPQILFIIVCKKAIFLYLAKTTIVEVIFSNNTMPHTIHIHILNFNIGIKMMRKTATKTISAIESNLAPKFVTRLYFLAMKPSATSLMPIID